MRNFSKTLISMAAVMAVGSAMAAGAMAAEMEPILSIGNPVANETETAKTVSIGNVREGLAQYTMIMVKGADPSKEAIADSYVISDGSSNTDVTIIQIDQNDEGEAFTEAIVPTDIADGNYMVVVGGSDGNVQRGYVKVSSTSDTPVIIPEEILLGNVNPNTVLDTADVLMILNKIKNPSATYQKAGIEKTVYETKTYACGRTLTKEDKIILGNVNPNTVLDTADVLMILNKIKSPNTTYQLAGENAKIYPEG